MKMTKYRAKHLFQAEPEWAVWVDLGIYDTEIEAKKIADHVGVHLIYEDSELICLIDKKVHKRFNDSEVKIELLKEESRDKAIMESWDYETQNIGISEMKNEPGLMTGFASLGYEIEPIEP